MQTLFEFQIVYKCSIVCSKRYPSKITTLQSKLLQDLHILLARQAICLSVKLVTILLAWELLLLS